MSIQLMPQDGEHAVDLEDRSSPTPEHRARIERSLSALRHEKTRRWEFLRVARRARTSVIDKRSRGQRTDLLLSHAEFRLLFALIEYADPDLSNSFPRVERLAKLEGWSTGMVRTTLRGLVEKGWIVRYGARGSKTNQFCVPAGAISRYAEGWEGPRGRRKERYLR